MRRVQTHGLMLPLLAILALFAARSDLLAADMIVTVAGTGIGTD
jgi:hypothetical protein